VLAILGRCIEGKDWAQGRAVCENAYPPYKLMISRRQAPEVSPVEAGGIAGRSAVSSGVSSGVCCLRQLGGGAPIHLHLQCVCWFFTVPFGQGRHPGVWFWRSIARCLSITAFTGLCPGNSTPRFFISRTLAPTFLDQTLHFLHRGAWKSSFGHSGYDKGQAHIWLFQLYMTFLPCHCCRHV